MCITLAWRVAEVADGMAEVERGGERRRVSLLLMAEPVAAGDYVLVQVGDFAVEKLDEATARQAMELVRELTGAGAGE